MGVLPAVAFSFAKRPLLLHFELAMPTTVVATLAGAMESATQEPPNEPPDGMMFVGGRTY